MKKHHMITSFPKELFASFYVHKVHLLHYEYIQHFLFPFQFNRSLFSFTFSFSCAVLHLHFSIVTFVCSVVSLGVAFQCGNSWHPLLHSSNIFMYYYSILTVSILFFFLAFASVVLPVCCW